VKAAWFDLDCRRCPRLAGFLDGLTAEYPQYHNRPVAPFGADTARLLVVGLAPGMHGANASGRPFTGDHAGLLLYRTLYAHGFADAAESLSADDGLELIDCRITNAVKCLPPQNKPVGGEVNACNGYLAAELADLADDAVVMALGGVAHKAVINALNLRQKDHVFAHGAEHDLGRLRLIDSYHCSRYNTQTRRLTEEMFDRVFARARALLDDSAAA
jgi:uracil-DNA glycosylase family 4